MQETDRSREGNEEGFATALAALTSKIEDACRIREGWPTKVGAGVYAAVDCLVEEPQIARKLLADPERGPLAEPFQVLVRTAIAFLAEVLPDPEEGEAAIPTAMVAGICLLVGEHIRVDRADRLPALRPDLHLMILLPYLGFEDAQRSVSSFQQRDRP
jgi:hypothetical protein